MAALLADFNAYLDQPDANPTADMVGYVQVPLWLSREDLGSMVEQVRATLAARLDNKPRPGRRLYLVSPIVFPIGQG
jgi:hypothetical protein